MNPTSTPIPLNHPRLAELIGKLGCEGVTVAVAHASSQLTASQCYGNVAERVRRFGGRMQLGWMLRMWPGVYLCAEHHALWQRPEGKLVDVTKPGGGIVGKAFTTFLHDDRIQVNPEMPPNIRSVYLPLTDSPNTTEFIARYEEFHACTDKLLHALSEADQAAVPAISLQRNQAQQRMFHARDKLAGKKV